eukprot:CAMPEP_0206535486 /NCGR_PEP_ID=MMETSP0325_2-20121206/6166_1 /ASSEMBLY_ACC=CAM_ASM_000347 /TAXON_ID=2866 /ORGANISM="Crypthecodinium cohnii, Strain Seligo" /LENGTH=543 /DNA_ID=CAMNT_0054032483 /DNA_START=323 /DNA_END=1954 /DNA_ORIENTATION=+
MPAPAGGKHQDAVAAAGLKQWFALRQSTAGGDGTEETHLLKAILAQVYQRTFDDSETLSLLPSCPEVGWLVECHAHCPLPPGWLKSKVAVGDVPEYFCEASGEIQEASPLLKNFVPLAEHVIRVRLDPVHAGKAVKEVHSLARELKALVADVEKKWSGPHIDSSSGNSYYHNAKTGQSVWEHPGSWAEFLAAVAERLLSSEAFVLYGASTSRLAAAEAEAAAAATASGAKASASSLPHEAELGEEKAPLPWQSGDAWGALDALMEMGGDDKPAQSSEGTTARWEEMQQWMASQPKQTSFSAPAKTGGYPQQEKPKLAPTALPKPDPKRLPPKPKLPAVPTSLPSMPPSAMLSAAAVPKVPTAVPAPTAAPAPPAPTAVPGGPKAPALKPATGPQQTPVAATPPTPAPAPGAAAAAAAATATQPQAVQRAAPAQAPAPAAPAPAPAAQLAAAPASASLDGLDIYQLASELARLAPEGSLPGPQDMERARKLLEAIEKLPATFEALRDTKLGIITKPYKDCPDAKVKAVVNRLRKVWKEVAKQVA